eukprot:TRINITY_DN7640_c0_g1_i1.p1 TRINITY_DN7640_c0_g1~~TRINITY_DN7640_c0_g1_i1.p1  ORF type:complete len:1167 (-),score=388.74 TRINITY_DN7640_c0_g1_i1:337-3837(-)
MGVIEVALRILKIDLPEKVQKDANIQQLRRTLECYVVLLPLILNFVRDAQSDPKLKAEQVRTGNIKRTVESVKNIVDILKEVSVYVESLVKNPDSVVNDPHTLKQHVTQMSANISQLISIILETRQKDAINYPPQCSEARATQIDELAGEIATMQGYVVVFLTGPDGSGKTTMALGLAQKVLSLYPDGPIYVPLRTDPDSPPLEPVEIMARIVHEKYPFMDINDNYEENIKKAYLTLFGENKKRILVLDDPHSVVQVRALIPEKQCDCCIIVTSSHENMLDENMFSLAIQLEGLADDDASFFLEQYSQKLSLNGPNPAATTIAVTNAINFTLAHPLNLKLVAGLVNIATDTRDVSDLHSKAQKIEPTPEFTLREALSKLKPDLYKILPFLCVFPSFFDAAAVASVLDCDHDKAHSIIGELLTAGFLEPDPVYRLYSRFYLHPSVYDMLKPSLEGDRKRQCQLRYITHYKRVITTCAWLHLLGGALPRLGFDLMDREIHNLENMLHLTMELEQHALCSQILGGRELIGKRIEPKTLINWYAAVSETFPEFSVERVDCLNEVGVAMLKYANEPTVKQLFDKAIAEARTSSYARGECEAHMNLGKLENTKGALEHFGSALDLARKIRSVPLEARTQYHFGVAAMALGQKTVDPFSKSVALLTKIDYKPELATAQAKLGESLVIAQDKSAAIEVFKDCLRTMMEVPNPLLEPFVTFHLANLLKDKGDAKSAIGVMEEKLNLERGNMSPDELAYRLSELAHAYSSAGDKVKSIQLFQQAMQLYVQTGNKAGQAAGFNNIATVLSQIGRKKKAIKLYEQAVRLADEAGRTSSQGVYLHHLAMVYKDLGLCDRAIELLKESLDIATKLKEESLEARRLNAMGVCFAAMEDFSGAVQLYDQALAVAEAKRDRRLEGCILHNLAMAFVADNKQKQAVDFLNSAIQISQELLDIQLQAEAYHDLGMIECSSNNRKDGYDHVMKALSLATNNGKLRLQLTVLLDLARLYAKDANPTTSTKYCNKALVLAKQIEPKLIPEIYYAMAANYRALKDPATTLMNYKNALMTAKKVGNERLMRQIRADMQELLKIAGQDPAFNDAYSKMSPAFRQLMSMEAKHGSESTLMSSYTLSPPVTPTTAQRNAMQSEAADLDALINIDDENQDIDSIADTFAKSMRR